MATGIGGHSPADLPRYLEGIAFPVNRKNLILHARQHHADPQMIDKLSQMPDDEYGSMDEVIQEYRQLH
ncbi:MAG: DUF2795 domain-containing protein [Desulfuromonadales bacterium]|nr:DUF2795 domain-containing protein [Desulfuromonadales bacterium]